MTAKYSGICGFLPLKLHARENWKMYDTRSIIILWFRRYCLREEHQLDFNFIFTNSVCGEKKLKWDTVTEQEVQYLRWLWMPAQCCPAAVRCTQPVCAACLAPVPSPGHCRICQQASGSARSSRSYQGLQKTNRAKKGGSHQWEKQEVKQRTEWDRIRKRGHHDNIACNVLILYN